MIPGRRRNLRKRAEEAVDRHRWAAFKNRSPEALIPRCAKCGRPMPGSGPLEVLCQDCRTVYA